jgi:hypothetical protein
LDICGIARGRRDCDRMVVGCTIICAISVSYTNGCEFVPRSWRGVLDTAVCDKVFQWFATRRWFSLSTPVSSTNKTDRHDITEILLKVALNIISLKTINQPYFAKRLPLVIGVMGCCIHFRNWEHYIDIKV